MLGETRRNAAISARLPYIMATSRFAHFLKVMARDKIGSFMEASDCEVWLNRWIGNYVNGNPNAGPEMKARYPQLIIAGREHGYFRRDETGKVVQAVLDSRCNILIVGLGAGRQEDFIRQAKRQGFGGVAFSCGAFIRQEAMAQGAYYPSLINRLNPRALYRMYREPHTILRYLLIYPANFLRLNYLLVRRRLEIHITPARKNNAHPVHS